MSDSFSIKLTRDDVTKDLQRLAGKVKDPRLMRAIGVGLVGLTVETFTREELRPSTWEPKKDGSPATLYRSGTLKRSIRVVSVTGTSVMIGSPMPYASIHQLGGQSRPMPARPFFPFVNRTLSRAGQQRVSDILAAYLKK